jgi:hypothetical protein
MARDRASLDITWRLESTALKKDSSPQELMKEILTSLEEALKEFAEAEKEIGAQDA